MDGDIQHRIACISETLFWVLLIAAIILIIRWTGPWSSKTRVPRGKNALDVLQDRYARGEIDREEFQQMKRDLEG